MNLPQHGDYIDIHNHDARSSDGVFSIETLMAHEGRNPADTPGIAYTYGIHPWYLNEENHDELIVEVKKAADNQYVIAIGECGFDKLKGPSTELQRKTFEEQIHISEGVRKPLVIHCVRAWDELIFQHKHSKPKMPWLIHGFRGKPDLAQQLISRGIYLSFWFDFILRPESANLIKRLPVDRIFLETDGSGVDIRDIYNKVSSYIEITTDSLKSIIFSNFYNFFNKKPLCT